MKFLTKAVLTTSVLLCVNTAFMGSRKFDLDFATLNLSEDSEQDTRSISTGFKASGSIVINDDIAEATRTLNLYNKSGCVNQTETFALAGYTEGTNAVLLKDKSSGSAVKMTFIWNYQNMGLSEKLSSKWGHFAGQKLAVSWKAASNTNVTPPTDGMTYPDIIGDGYKITNIHYVVDKLNIPSIVSTFTNTSGKPMRKVFIDINRYKGNLLQGQGSSTFFSLTSGMSIELNSGISTRNFDRFEYLKPTVYY